MRLAKLREAGLLDFSRAAVDSSSVRAVGAGEKLAGTHGSLATRFQTPHLVDANGVPLSAILTGADHNDVTQLLPLVNATVPNRCIRGHPLQKPKIIYADRGYDSEPHRRKLRERGTKPGIANRRTWRDSGLGKFRWVVGRTHAWLHNFRRLCIRFERPADIHEAFLKPGCSLVCWSIFRHTGQSL